MHAADGQQALLLDVLASASGEPVSFAELQASGVHYPASVASELMLAGYKIERVHDHGRTVGVRLPERRLEHAATKHADRRRPWPFRRPALGTD